MLRLVFAASRQIFQKTPPSLNSVSNLLINTPRIQNFSLLSPLSVTTQGQLLKDPRLINISNNIVSRSLIKYSYRKGKRKGCKAVIRRFYRLNWGGWIHAKCGRQKKLWKKSPPRKRRLRQHVFCNSTQSTLLDKMVGEFWRKPKYYVEDPYEPYHTREEFQFSRIKPKPYFPAEK